jgi:hypothetical protein
VEPAEQLWVTGGCWPSQRIEFRKDHGRLTAESSRPALEFGALRALAKRYIIENVLRPPDHGAWGRVDRLVRLRADGRAFVRREAAVE